MEMKLLALLFCALLLRLPTPLEFIHVHNGGALLPSHEQIDAI
jgi:hypothetical protein